MQASYNQIQNVLIPALLKKGMELVDFKDPAYETQDTGGTPVKNKSQLQTAQERWLQVHTTDSRGDMDKSGGLVIRVTMISPESSRGKQDTSSFTDPVDLDGSGLDTWAAAQKAR
jgi:hypothetical protein